MIDLVTRTLLLLAAVYTVGASIVLARKVRPARRLALLGIIPAASSWAIFEIVTMISRPELSDVLTTPVWWSRLSLFLTLVSWYIVRWTIRTTEQAEQRYGKL